MKSLLSLLAACLLLSGCGHQGAIYQTAPFSPPVMEEYPSGDPEKAKESLQKAAAALEELGVEGAAEAGARLAEEVPAEDLAYFITDTSDAARWLLSDLGYGEWAEDTWEWSPTSDQVFYLDFEVFNLDRMYTDTLAGIAAIVGKDAVFANVTEDLSAVDYEADSGTQTITFTCNGTPCRYDAEFMGDRLDAGFLTYMGRVVVRLKTGKQLYTCFDGGQGCILLWRTPQWTEQLQKATGLQLEPAAGYFR